MQTLSFEVQNGLIRQILDISDINILSELQTFLQKKQSEKYKLTAMQKSLLAQSERDSLDKKLIDNDLVFEEIEKWTDKQ